MLVVIPAIRALGGFILSPVSLTYILIMATLLYGASNTELRLFIMRELLQVALNVMKHVNTMHDISDRYESHDIDTVDQS